MNRSPATVGFTWSSVLFVVVFSFGVSFASEISVEEKRQLVVLSWSDYVDPDLIGAFEKKTGARVNFVYYETDELKDDLLIATDGTGYDVVVTAGHSMRPYLRRNWVARLSTREVPNLKHLDPRWIDADPEWRGYGVPYFWRTLGIAYRKDLVPETISSWRQLFQPASYLRGKIVMLKDSRECIGLALKSLGYPFNSAEPRHYEEVE